MVFLGFAVDLEVIRERVCAQSSNIEYAELKNKSHLNRYLIGATCLVTFTMPIEFGPL